MVYLRAVDLKASRNSLILTYCRFQRRSASALCTVPNNSISSVGWSNRVVVTGGPRELKENEAMEVQVDRRNDLESDKDWGNYWDRYDREIKDTVRDTTAKQTTV